MSGAELPFPCTPSCRAQNKVTELYLDITQAASSHFDTFLQQSAIFTCYLYRAVIPSRLQVQLNRSLGFVLQSYLHKYNIRSDNKFTKYIFYS